MAVYDNWLYIYGGEDFFGANNNFIRYNIINENFEILNGDDARSYATLVAYNNYLYLFGGKDESNIPTNTLKEYDIVNNLWKTFGPQDVNAVANIPKPCYSHIAIIHKDCLYIQGGRDNNGTVAPNMYKLYFDPDPNSKPTWSFQAIKFERYEHAAALVNGEIYLFGGSDGTENKNDLWKYTTNPLAATLFTQVTPQNNNIILPRAGMQMAAINNKLYIYGGKNGSLYYNDILSYSLIDNLWTNLGNGPALRSDYALTTYNNSIYYYGGHYINSTRQTIYYSELWEFTPASH